MTLNMTQRTRRKLVRRSRRSLALSSAQSSSWRAPPTSVTRLTCRPKRHVKNRSPFVMILLLLVAATTTPKIPPTLLTLVKLTRRINYRCAHVTPGPTKFSLVTAPTLPVNVTRRLTTSTIFPSTRRNRRARSCLI